LVGSGSTKQPIEEGGQMAGQASARWRSAGREREVSGWAVGLIFCAAVVMFIGGIAKFFAGLAAVPGTVPYAFTSGNQLLDFNLTTWGWTLNTHGVVARARRV
jgi:hypothetical protein